LIERRRIIPERRVPCVGHHLDLSVGQPGFVLIDDGAQYGSNSPAISRNISTRACSRRATGRMMSRRVKAINGGALCDRSSLRAQQHWC
jgi:hypothetical protein